MPLESFIEKIGIILSRQPKRYISKGKNGHFLKKINKPAMLLIYGENLFNFSLESVSKPRVDCSISVGFSYLIHDDRSACET